MTDAAANSIVLIIDGLGPFWLGPYGNTWFDTPTANQLAAESLLVEHVQIESPTLPGAYAALWRGACPLRGGGAGPLPAELAGQGVLTALLTDEPEVAELPDAAGFGEHHPWTAANVDAAAADPLETNAGLLLAAACELAESLAEPFCLWVHVQGLAGLWDAPWEFRAELADEEDPEPPREVIPPSGPLPPDDPDLLLGWMQAAAAQVRVIDHCLAPLAAAAARRRALLAVSSCRGYPLGEHGQAGLESPGLYAELLQAPLLVRRPDGAGAAMRSQQLVQGAGLGAAVRGWHRLGPEPRWPPLPDPAQQLAVSADGEQTAVRTASWFARLAGDAEPVELYVKPDDRFEANEVADRCPAEAEAMRGLVAALRRGENPQLPPRLWQPHW